MLSNRTKLNRIAENWVHCKRDGKIINKKMVAVFFNRYHLKFINYYYIYTKYIVTQYTYMLYK